MNPIFLLSMPSGWQWLNSIFIFLVIYFIPSIIGIARKKKNRAFIADINIFLGWTLIGWVVALIWSVTKDKQYQNIEVNQSQSEAPQLMLNEEATKKCPYCAEIIKQEAIKCKHCGETFVK